FRSPGVTSPRREGGTANPARGRGYGRLPIGGRREAERVAAAPTRGMLPLSRLRKDGKKGREMFKINHGVVIAASAALCMSASAQLVLTFDVNSFDYAFSDAGGAS